MNAEKLVTTAMVLLFGGYMLIQVSDALVAQDSGFSQIATAIIGAFIVAAIAKLRGSR